MKNNFNMRGLMKINNTITEYLFDTGTSQTVMSSQTFNEICRSQTNPPKLVPSHQTLISANSKIMDRGKADMTLEVGQ